MFICLLLTIFLSQNTLANNGLLNHINTCGFGRRDLSEISGCLRQTIEILLRDATQGRPTLGLKLGDPLRVPEFQFLQNHGAINIEANFRNILATGHSNSRLTTVEASRSPPSLTMGLFIPHLYITGNYIAGGNVLLLPIKGDGSFNIRLNNTHGVLRSRLVVGKDANGKDVIQPADTRISLEIEHIRTHLDGLFDDDPILSESIIHFINENSQLILEEVRPRITQMIANIAERLMKNALAQIPISSIYPDRSIVQRFRN